MSVVNKNKRGLLSGSLSVSYYLLMEPIARRRCRQPPNENNISLKKIVKKLLLCILQICIIIFNAFILKKE